MSKRIPVHIFSACFTDRASAMEFATPVYDEFDEAVCPLWDAVGQRTDGDFVETIFGAERFEYLQSVLLDPCQADAVRQADEPRHNTLFLIYAQEGNADLVPQNCIGMIRFLATHLSKL